MAQKLFRPLGWWTKRISRIRNRNGHRGECHGVESKFASTAVRRQWRRAEIIVVVTALLSSLCAVLTTSVAVAAGGCPGTNIAPFAVDGTAPLPVKAGVDTSGFTTISLRVAWGDGTPATTISGNGSHPTPHTYGFDPLLGTPNVYKAQLTGNGTYQSNGSTVACTISAPFGVATVRPPNSQQLAVAVEQQVPVQGRILNYMASAARAMQKYWPKVSPGVVIAVVLVAVATVCAANVAVCAGAVTVGTATAVLALAATRLNTRFGPPTVPSSVS